MKRDTTKGITKTRHAEMARLLVSGKSPSEIADQFSIGVGTLYKIMRSPMFREKMDELSRDSDEAAEAAMSRYRSALVDAIDNHVIAIQEKNPLDKKLQLELSDKLIDREYKRRYGSVMGDTGAATIRLQQINIYAEKIRDVTDIKELTRLLEEQMKLSSA